MCEPARDRSSLCGAFDSHLRWWLLALCSRPRARAHAPNAISTQCHVWLVRAFCAHFALLHAASVRHKLIAERCTRWLCAAADCACCAHAIMSEHARLLFATNRQCQRRLCLYSKNVVLMRCVHVTLAIDTLSTSATSVLFTTPRLTHANAHCCAIISLCRACTALVFAHNLIEHVEFYPINQQTSYFTHYTPLTHVNFPRSHTARTLLCFLRRHTAEPRRACCTYCIARQALFPLTPMATAVSANNATKNSTRVFPARAPYTRLLAQNLRSISTRFA